MDNYEEAIAIYDYNAPRDDICSFSKNTVIKIFEKKTDQWWRGEANGKIGLIPSSYVKIIEKTNISTITAVVLYDYKSEKEGFLCINKGNILTIISQDNSEWWRGSLDGKIGYVPVKYLQIQTNINTITNNIPPPLSTPQMGINQTTPLNIPPPLSTPQLGMNNNTFNSPPLLTPPIGLNNISLNPPPLLTPQLGMNNNTFTPPSLFNNNNNNTGSFSPLNIIPPPLLTPQLSVNQSTPSNIPLPLGINTTITFTQPPNNIPPPLNQSNGSIPTLNQSNSIPNNLTQSQPILSLNTPSPQFNLHNNTSSTPQIPNVFNMPQKRQGIAIHDYEINKKDYLSFKKGEAFIILDSSTQWWRVQDSNGNIGFVPSTYVKDLDNPSNSQPNNTPSTQVSQSPSQQPQQPQQTRVKIKYDFTGERQDMLTIKAGDVLVLVEKTNESWWRVLNESTQQQGLIPSTYAEVLEEQQSSQRPVKKVAPPPSLLTMRGTSGSKEEELLRIREELRKKEEEEKRKRLDELENNRRQEAERLERLKEEQRRKEEEEKYKRDEEHKKKEEEERQKKFHDQERIQRENQERRIKEEEYKRKKEEEKKRQEEEILQRKREHEEKQKALEEIKRKKEEERLADIERKRKEVLEMQEKELKEREERARKMQEELEKKRQEQELLQENIKKEQERHTQERLKQELEKKKILEEQKSQQLELDRQKKIEHERQRRIQLFEKEQKELSAAENRVLEIQKVRAKKKQWLEKLTSQENFNNRNSTELKEDESNGISSSSGEIPTLSGSYGHTISLTDSSENSMEEMNPPTNLPPPPNFPLLQPPLNLPPPPSLPNILLQPPLNLPPPVEIKRSSSDFDKRNSGENSPTKFKSPSNFDKRSSGEHLRTSGEHLRNSGEHLRNSGENKRNSGDNNNNQRNSGENSKHNPHLPVPPRLIGLFSPPPNKVTSIPTDNNKTPEQLESTSKRVSFGIEPENKRSSSDNHLTAPTNLPPPPKMFLSQTPPKVNLQLPPKNTNRLSIELPSDNKRVKTPEQLESTSKRVSFGIEPENKRSSSDNHVVHPSKLNTLQTPPKTNQINKEPPTNLPPPPNFGTKENRSPSHSPPKKEIQTNIPRPKSPTLETNNLNALDVLEKMLLMDIEVKNPPTNLPPPPKELVPLTKELVPPTNLPPPPKELIPPTNLPPPPRELVPPTNLPPPPKELVPPTKELVPPTNLPPPPKVFPPTKELVPPTNLPPPTPTKKEPKKNPLKVLQYQPKQEPSHPRDISPPTKELVQPTNLPPPPNHDNLPPLNDFSPPKLPSPPQIITSSLPKKTPPQIQPKKITGSFSSNLGAQNSNSNLEGTLRKEELDISSFDGVDFEQEFTSSLTGETPKTFNKVLATPPPIVKGDDPFADPLLMFENDLPTYVSGDSNSLPVESSTNVSLHHPSLPTPPLGDDVYNPFDNYSQDLENILNDL